MSEPDMAAKALEYARHGLAVLPVTVEVDGVCSCPEGAASHNSPGKHPYTAHGALDATTDPEIIDEWWRRWPMANIGINPGASLMHVLDLDGPGAFAELAELEHEHGALPPTLTVVTGRGDGGQHRWFRLPEGVEPLRGVDLTRNINTRGVNGYVLAPPSLHPTGRRYEPVSRSVPPAELPAWVIDRLTSKVSAEAPPTETPPAQWSGAGDGDQLWQAVIPERLQRFAGMPPDSKRGTYAFALARKARQLANAGRGTTDPERIVRLILERAAANGLLAADGEASVRREALRGWLAGAGEIDPRDLPRSRPVAHVNGASIVDRATSPPPSQTSVSAVIARARAYLDMTDVDPLLAVLAAAVSAADDGEPLWLLLVAPPSSGKTELTRALDDLADARTDDVTAAGLLSWKAGKRPRPVGVLTRIGSRALVTFGDLSTLIAGSDKSSSARDATFALLRRAYDGHVVRDLGNAPEPLEWAGRLTVVAAVTGVIDRYAAHADALGPRWVYARLPDRSTSAKRAAARAARRGQLAGHREAFRQAVTDVVTDARRRLSEIPDDLGDDLEDVIEDVALVVCWGRAAVPRHGYGSRSIDGAPVIEEPPRVVHQLRGLARGLLALDVPAPIVERVVRRCGLDSMPADRRAVLDVLSWGEPLTTSGVASSAGLHRHVVRMRLEELEAVGVVASTRQGPEPGEEEVDRRTATWTLDGEDGVLVAQVTTRRPPSATSSRRSSPRRPHWTR